MDEGIEVRQGFEVVRSMLSTGSLVDVEAFAGLCARALRGDPVAYANTWLPHIESTGVCLEGIEQLRWLVDLVDPRACRVPGRASSPSSFLEVCTWGPGGVVEYEPVRPDASTLVLLTRAPARDLEGASVGVSGPWSPWYTFAVCDPSVSRRHAVLEVGGRPGATRVVDLGSTHGTHVSRGSAGGELERVTSAWLDPMDCVYAGHTRERLVPDPASRTPRARRGF
jgi:hypothetical protein